MRNMHLPYKKWNNQFLATVIACTIPVAAAHASGFRIPEVSAAGTASANALVANTEELGAVAYNPAIISFQSGKAVMLGLNHISYEVSVTPGAPNTGPTRDGNGEDSFLVPNLLLSTVGENNWAFALLINSPFGLETSWADETFTSFDGTVISAGPPPITLDNLEPALSRIKMLNFNPNLSYKLDNNSSVSFGLDFYDVIDLTFNSQAIKINGTGNGVGWNIGIVKKMDKLTLGASYRSKVETDITGSFDSTGIGSSVIGAQAKLEFPDIFQLGLHYQATQSLGIEFDVDRTGWSSFDQIKIQDSLGTTLTSSTNNWNSSWAYRLGFTYKVSSGTKIMFGYAYDESPQPDEYFSARVPDADRQLFSIGASHNLGGWILEYSYMYVDVDSRTINSSAGFAGEPNGTALYNGTYETDVSLIGVSLATNF